MVRLNRRCKNALGISHLTSWFSYSLCTASRLPFVSGHFMCSARVQSSCFPVSVSSYLLPLLGGGAFSLLVMPALSWQQGFFRPSSYGLWRDGHDPGVLVFLPYLLPSSFFMLHTSKLAMRCDTRVLVLRFDMLRWFAYVDIQLF